MLMVWYALRTNDALDTRRATVPLGAAPYRNCFGQGMLVACLLILTLGLSA